MEEPVYRFQPRSRGGYINTGEPILSENLFQTPAPVIDLSQRRVDTIEIEYEELPLFQPRSRGGFHGPGGKR